MKNNIPNEKKFKMFTDILSRFQILSTEDFDLVYPCLTHIKLKKKEYFVNFNQKITHIGFIINGIFRTYYVNEKGNEITTCFCHENGFINTMPISMAQINVPCAIQAIEPSELLILSFEDLNKLFLRSKNWLVLAFKLTQMGVVFSFNLSIKMSDKEAIDKYNEFIKTNPGLANRVPLQYLASYLGISKETLSRVRKRQLL